MVLVGKEKEGEEEEEEREGCWLQFGYTLVEVWGVAR